MPAVEVWACRSCGEFDRIYFPRWTYASADNLRDATQYRYPSWSPWDGDRYKTGDCYCENCGRMRRTTKHTTVVP